MKIFKKILGAVTGFAMFLVPILAIGTAANAVTASPTSVTITKEVNNVTNPVVNTFTYTVTPDAGNPATLTGVPASFTIAFDGTETNSGNKVTKTGTFDLSSVDFTKVGDYKFKIEETGSTNSSLYPTDSDYWVAYVSVRYELVNGTNTPTSTMIATTAANGTKNASDGTTNKGPIVFVTDPDFTHIELSKEVTGNLGDISKYFAFEVNLGADMSGKSVTVVGNHSADGSTAATSPATYTATGGKITLYLKHGQSVQIGLTAASNGLEQIPTGTQYTITETAGDYTPYIDGATTSSNTVTKTTVATNAATFATNNTTAYVNNLESSVITGIFVNYWPFILLVVLGVVGMYAMRKVSKKVN